MDNRFITEQTVLGRLIVRKGANRAMPTEANFDQLQDNEELFHLMVESVQDYAIYMLDVSGHIVTWNTGAERIKGYKAEEITGRHFSIFFAQDDIEHRRPDIELDNAILKGHFEDEGWRVRKDGSQFWANVVITALKDRTGRLRGFSKVTRDITERKEAEEILRNSEERFRMMVTAVQDYAIYMLSADGKVMSWNAGAQRLKGYRAEEIIGKHFSTFYNQDVIEQGKAARGLQIAAVEGRFEDEGWRVHKDGPQFWANVIITALRDETGQLRGFSKVTRDLTERKKAEEKILQLNAELEQRVVVRTAELLAANKELESFSYSISHDLRAPLRHVQGYAAMLATSTAGALPGKAQRYLQTIIDASADMAQLIDDLLAFSRLGRSEMRGVQVNVEEVAREIIREFEMTVGDRQIAWNVEFLPQVIGDLPMLKQVLVNLIGNAIKYTSKQESAAIHIGYRGCEDDQPIFFVRDNGAGFDMRYVHKLFGVFQRLHRVDEFEGTGIGLAIVRRIVARHGGRVWAEGALDSGATFYFTLPPA